MTDERTHAAIEAADTDELLRIVDGLVGARAWEDLVGLRARCREAVSRGKQLWSIDEHIRYRLALEGPAGLAGPAVTEGPARFTPGPLTEVAASTHTWAELAPHLSPGPERSLVAHERVVRGEALDGQALDPGVFDLPLRLEPWEPGYPLAEYRSDRVEAPPPALPGMAPAEGRPGRRLPDPAGAEALAALVSAWTNESNGRVEVAAVEGDVAAAVAALGAPAFTLAEVDLGAAMAWMAWAAATGGAHGRRRGTAAGRFDAWWALSALGGVEWPPDPDVLGSRGSELRWFVWSDGFTTGWVMRLAAEDPSTGRAWAVAALDEV